MDKKFTISLQFYMCFTNGASCERDGKQLSSITYHGDYTIPLDSVIHTGGNGMQFVIIAKHPPLLLDVLVYCYHGQITFCIHM